MKLLPESHLLWNLNSGFSVDTLKHFFKKSQNIFRVSFKSYAIQFFGRNSKIELSFATSNVKFNPYLPSTYIFVSPKECLSITRKHKPVNYWFLAKLDKPVDKFLLLENLEIWPISTTVFQVPVEFFSSQTFVSSKSCLSISRRRKCFYFWIFIEV